MEVKLPGHKYRTQKSMQKAIKACTLINAGMSVVDVAKLFGVTRTRVYQWKNAVVQYGKDALKRPEKATKFQLEDLT
jgi:transposase